jgi:hypothetical protein
MEASLDKKSKESSQPQIIKSKLLCVSHEHNHRIGEVMKVAAKPAKEKGGGAGGGVKITVRDSSIIFDSLIRRKIGLSNSQVGSSSSGALSNTASTPQIPENLSTIITISDLCLIPDGRKAQNKRKKPETQAQLNEIASKGPKNQPSRRSHRQETENSYDVYHTFYVPLICCRSGPQVEIINGKIVIKESSLVRHSDSTSSPLIQHRPFPP